MVGPGDAREDHPERARITAGPAHQVDAVPVRRALNLARLGGLQHGARADHDRAAADEIAQQHAEQE